MSMIIIIITRIGANTVVYVWAATVMQLSSIHLATLAQSAITTNNIKRPKKQKKDEL